MTQGRGRIAVRAVRYFAGYFAFVSGGVRADLRCLLVVAGMVIAGKSFAWEPFTPIVPANTSVPKYLRFDLDFQQGPKCGVNAIYAMLRLLGRPVAYADVESRIPVTAEGADLESMAAAAREFGLDVEVRKGVTPDDLLEAPLPMVVHIRASPVDSQPLARDHFMVVSRCRRTDSGNAVFDIVDTTNLRFMKYRLDGLAQNMTGYVLAPRGGAGNWLRARNIERALLACLLVILVADGTLASIYWRERARAAG
jgi:Peptidase C39 family